MSAVEGGWKGQELLSGGATGRDQGGVRRDDGSHDRDGVDATRE